MRAADLVRNIWGAPPPANLAKSANAAPCPPRHSQDSQNSQGVGQRNFRPPSQLSQLSQLSQPLHSIPFVQGIEASNDPDLRDLLALHGGFHGVDWQGLALIDAAQSALWIVQRPDGLLTTLATVEPISKPTSYRQAWPARFTSPEPEAAAPAAPVARAVIERARQSCWGCRHLDTHQRPTCALRHPVAWQMAQTRTYPRRFDATNCGDGAQGIS